MDMNETSDLKPTIIKNLGQKIGYTPKNISPFEDEKSWSDQPVDYPLVTPAAKECKLT